MPKMRAMPIIVVRRIDGSEVELDVRCECCGKTYGLTVGCGDYLRYLSQAGLIQDVFPYLRPALRELFVSGTCPKCWREIFSEEAGGESHYCAA